MNEIVDYVVAFAPLRSPDVIGGAKILPLQDLVKQEMQKGWSPMGSVNLFTHGDVIHAGQALVKYKEPEPAPAPSPVEQKFPEIAVTEPPKPGPGRPKKVEV